MERTTNNTNGVIREIGYGNHDVVAELTTLLGPRFMLPKAGVIRSGVMALKKDCSKNDQAVYEAMVGKGGGWEEIDEKLGTDGKGKSKLIPRNVDYFSIHARDCKDAEDAGRIHDLYADTDGRLRSFPVVFPVNEWWNVIPHSLRCFGETRGLKFKSDFRLVSGGSEVERVCRFPLDAEPGKRVFGGRKWDERPCEPDVCTEYQKGECKFGGVIQFYVPGIKGIGVWLLPTTSWYSLLNVKSTLETVSRITGGKIAGVFNGKPIFRLKKTREKVSRIDVKTGKPVKTGQWLINLEVDVDVTELAARYERSSVLARGEEAARVLSAPKPALSRAETHESVKPEDVTERKKEGKVGAGSNGNGKDNGTQSLTNNAMLLWEAISKTHKNNKDRKRELRRLTDGVESFYALTEEQAGSALERLTTETLNRF